MRSTFVELRGEEIEIQYMDHGYDPETRAGALVEWDVVDPGNLIGELTEEERETIEEYVHKLCSEPQDEE